MKTIVDVANGTLDTVGLDAADLAQLQTDADRLAALLASATFRNAPIYAALAEIDAKSIRPLRAILKAQNAGGTADPVDLDRLADLKAQADALRSTLVS